MVCTKQGQPRATPRVPRSEAGGKPAARHADSPLARPPWVRCSDHCVTPPGDSGTGQPEHAARAARGAGNSLCPGCRGQSRAEKPHAPEAPAPRLLRAPAGPAAPSRPCAASARLRLPSPPPALALPRASASREPFAGDPRTEPRTLTHADTSLPKREMSLCDLACGGRFTHVPKLNCVCVTLNKAVQKNLLKGTNASFCPEAVSFTKAPGDTQLRGGRSTRRPEAGHV